MTETETEADFPALCDWRDPGAGAGAHVLIHDAGGRVLLQLRDDIPGMAYPGRWSLFGGGVEPGETLRAAAVREVAEETGLALPPASLTPLGRILSRWGRSGLRLFVYAAPMPQGPETVRLDEGAGFALATPAQTDALDLIPEFRPAIARFRAARG